MHPGFFSHLQDTFESFPPALLDHYREASGKIRFKLEGIQKLQAVEQELKPYSNYKLLAKAIHNLVSIFSPKGIVEVEHLRTIVSYIKQVRKELKNFMDNERSKSHITNLKLFTKSPAEFNKFVDKIENALNEMNMVINMRNERGRAVRAL